MEIFQFSVCLQIDPHGSYTDLSGKEFDGDCLCRWCRELRDELDGQQYVYWLTKERDDVLKEMT